MANIKARGVIIRQNDYGEGHRMLTVFAEEYGIIKAVSYGVKRAKSKAAASSQFLCFADFDLYKPPNRDVLTVNSIDTVDGFYPICEDIVKLSLCSYLADITYELLGPENPDDRILRIFLNSLYALAYRGEDAGKVKTVYELKLMSAGGYMPNMNRCAVCGSEDVRAFDAAKGSVVCAECAGADAVKISGGAYKAIHYIISSDDKKMLSFNVSDALLAELNSVSERYVSVQTDRRFKSLGYYKSISES